MFQLRLTAKDQGVPQNAADTTVTITVIRNKYTPAFTARNYFKSIPDTQPIGDNILTVTATDKDPSVRTTSVSRPQGGHWSLNS